ncbi:hypothetical protein EVAR_45523_1 [Eumeta japonica]|uniref:Uncharacterized protein n=1 Tax=Eumeta variegata TaxID=151549 RepID=A0A4C1X851_EUMVA|nr:hypothetical protein EVAR_45523_1 [Eumeta japonica]
MQILASQSESAKTLYLSSKLFSPYTLLLHLDRDGSLCVITIYIPTLDKSDDIKDVEDCCGWNARAPVKQSERQHKALTSSVTSTYVVLTRRVRRDAKYYA